MNTVNIVGNVGKKPELFKTSKGMSVAQFSLAYQRSQDMTDWFNCVAYDKTADLVIQHVDVGMKLAITGRLITDTYDDKDTGKKIQRVKIVATNITFVEKKKDNNSGYNGILKNKESTGGYHDPSGVANQEVAEPKESPDNVYLADINADDLPF